MVVVPPVVSRMLSTSELDVRGGPGVIYIFLTFLFYFMFNFFYVQVKKGIYSAGDSTE